MDFQPAPSSTHAPPGEITNFRELCTSENKQRLDGKLTVSELAVLDLWDRTTDTERLYATISKRKTKGIRTLAMRQLTVDRKLTSISRRVQEAIAETEGLERRIVLGMAKRILESQELKILQLDGSLLVTTVSSTAFSPNNENRGERHKRRKRTRDM